MKIVLFTDTFYDTNGVSRFLQDIARIAYEKGDKFTFVTSTCKDFGVKDLPNVINIKPLFRMKMPFYEDLDLVIPNIKRLTKVFCEEAPDVVHISTPGFIGLLGRYLALKYKKPIAGVYHTNFPSYMQKNIPNQLAYKITLLFMKFFYNPFSLVFSRSDEYIKHLKEEVGVKNSARLISGIDIETFSPLKKDNTYTSSLARADDADVKVLYVGRLTKEKNFAFLIEVWKKFHKKMEKKQKKVVLICAGDGKFMEQKELLEEHNMFLVGKKTKEELSYMYPSVNFFLFPSTTDTLGQVVMESLASKTPVIVSDKGGPMEIINEAKTPCGLALSIDKELWVEAVSDFSEDRNKLVKMGESGYKMMQNHSIKKSYEDFWKTHTSLL